MQEFPQFIPEGSQGFVFVLCHNFLTYNELYYIVLQYKVKESMSEQATNYIVKLKKHATVAERTMAFELEKPAGFTFKPGQWIDITLPNPSESTESAKIHGFSIASAPEDATLTVATRMRDTAFKRVLGQLPPNSEVEITMPGGSFTLHNNPEKAAIFLVGGIGITPVRSILRHAAQLKLPHRIIVFYSNSTPENTAFLEELQTLEKANPNFTFVPTMTKMEESKRSWEGERGHITKEMLEKYTQDAKSPIYYVVGPPKMVRGLQKMLEDAGRDTDDIRSEGFGGY